MMRNLLTIAGSDSSGGAGIQADLKTFAAHGTFGMSVITAVTAQNTTGVFAVQDIDPVLIRAQMEAVFTDIRVDAVKIGMLSVPSTIEAVADGLEKFHPSLVVVDPVMVSKSGFSLLQSSSCTLLIDKILPLADVLTPNIPEAEVICGFSVEDKDAMVKAAQKIHTLGVKNVLLKGGHLTGNCDDLLYDGKDLFWFEAGRVSTKHTHGTGCSLSSALAANLAKGLGLQEAVRGAKKYVFAGIERGLPIGSGCGPIHHFVELYRKAGLEE